MNKIVHILCDSHITNKFVDFSFKNFDNHNHIYLNYFNKYTYLKHENIVKSNMKSINGFIKIIKLLYKSEKIVLHGLHEKYFLLLLFLNPLLLKKCYWFLWGADLYKSLPTEGKKINSFNYFIKSKVIKNLGYIVTYIKGDFYLAKEHFKTKAQYMECIMYTSNIYHDFKPKEKYKSNTIILAGNSASKTNNHTDLFNKLKKIKDDNIKLFVPLAYGDMDYAKEVIKKGKIIFKDKMIPIQTFMPLTDYSNFLGSVDIAIFNHRRQEGMGNIITLLGLGKKVYLSKETTTWIFFKQLGVKVFANYEFDIKPLDKVIQLNNIKIIKKYFSEQNLLSQLHSLYSE